jgi:hypothetical protein
MILKKNHNMSSNTNNNIKVYKLGVQQPVNRNQKTRLCKNVSTCAFGDRCHYAHKLDDLKIADCAFGNECIFVTNESNGYMNKNNVKLCYFRHPNEDDNHYNIRIGNIIVSTPPPPPPPILDPPIRLSFDENDPSEWVTIKTKKKQPEEVCVTVSNVEVLDVLREMLNKGVKRVCLTITY